MAEEKTDRFTRPHGEGKTYSTPRLPMKKGERKEDFYKRMNELGYGQGDLEKVPHHWNSDDNEMHRGEASESCRFCKPTKRQIAAKANKESGEKPKPPESKEESTTSTDKSSEGGSETSEDSENKSPVEEDAKGKKPKRKRGRPPKKKDQAKSASTSE